MKQKKVDPSKMLGALRTVIILVVIALITGLLPVSVNIQIPFHRGLTL